MPEVGRITLPVVADLTGLAAGLTAAEALTAASAARMHGIMGGAAIAGAPAAIAAGTTEVVAAGAAAQVATAKVAGFGGAMGKVGLMMGAAFGGAMVVGQISSTIMAASDLNETLNLTGLIFGSNKDAMVKWGETAVDTMGMTQTAALNTASGFANLFMNVGMSAENSMMQSQKLTSLAADMSSAFNTSVEEATQAMTAGLIGQTEPLRRYGIMLDELSLKEKARQLGIFEGNGVLNQAQKAQAAYALILQATSKIQGDWLNTKEDPANAMRQVALQIDAIKEQLGKALLPTVKNVLEMVNGTLGWARENTELVKTLIEVGIKVGIIAVAMKYWATMNDLVVAGFGKIRLAWVAMQATMTGGIGSMVGSWKTGIASMISAMGPLLAVVAAIEALQIAYNSIQDTNNVQALSTYLENNSKLEMNKTAPEKAVGLAADVGASAVNLVDNIPVLNSFMSSMGWNPMDDVRKAREEAAKKTQEESAKKTEEATIAKEKETEAVNKATEQQKAAADAVKAYNAAVLNAGKTYFDSHPGYGEDQQAKNIEAANKDIADKQKQVKDAQDAVTEAKNKYYAGSKEILDAEATLAERQKELTEARENARKAREGVGPDEQWKRLQKSVKTDTRNLKEIEALGARGLDEAGQSGLWQLEESDPGSIHTSYLNMSDKQIEDFNNMWSEKMKVDSKIGKFITDMQAELDKIWESIGFSNGSAWGDGYRKSLEGLDIIAVQQGYQGTLPGDPAALWSNNINEYRFPNAGKGTLELLPKWMQPYAAPYMDPRMGQLGSLTPTPTATPNPITQPPNPFNTPGFVFGDQGTPGMQVTQSNGMQVGTVNLTVMSNDPDVMTKKTVEYIRRNSPIGKKS